jgi:gas vesicle protein
MAMLVTSAFPAVLAKGKPQPGPVPGKKYQYQTDLKNGIDHIKDAKKKMQHDYHKLVIGVKRNDIGLKMEAKQSFQDAIAELKNALNDLRSARNNAMDELTDNMKKLKSKVDFIDKLIRYTMKLINMCMQIIPLIDKLIELEEEMANAPPELREHFERIERTILGQIKDIYKGK